MTSFSLDVLEFIEVGSLTPAARNARTHSEKQIEQIKKSIERFGFINPCLIDDRQVLVAGHGRLEAAKRLGLDKVPCLRLSNMSDAEKLAYLLADNQLATKSGWDREILAIEAKELSEAGFDLTVVGFELPEIEILIGEADEADPKSTIDKADECPEPSDRDPVTRRGDLWVLGRHRLLCGNARSADDVQTLMDGEAADMIFADAPYNLPIQRNVSGLGRITHREFAEASGEMSSAEFTEFLTATLGAAAAVCRDGAIAYTCMDWRHFKEMHDAGHRVFSEQKNLCVWQKVNAGMGSFYRSQHELIFVWKVGTAPHINTFGLGGKGRHRTNVWTFAGVNGFRAGRLNELSSHPTVKPVAMVAEAIKDVTHRGHIVLDTFGGSGTTLIAAERTGRAARLIEIDETYCDVIVRRWEALTGKFARHAKSNETFEHTYAVRNGWGASGFEVEKAA